MEVLLPPFHDPFPIQEHRHLQAYLNGQVYTDQ